MKSNDLAVTDAMEASAANLEAKGKTVVFCAWGKSIHGIVAISDSVRPEAKSVVNHLRTVSNVDVWMITGDNRATALAVADDLGIPSDHVLAEVLPKDKSDKVVSLQKQPLKEGSEHHRTVAFVGDGINDAPALTVADIGLAIGAGTEIAIEAADMVLMRSNLCDVVTALDIGRRTYNRIRINFLFAFLYNVIGIPIAAGVLYPAIHPATLPPAAAGLAMALSSVSVVLSSLWLKRYRKPHIIDVDHFLQTADSGALVATSCSKFTGDTEKDWNASVVEL
jgi:Cu+-exporting ATPase